MTVDPIVALESLGYTEREASFLYLVAVHSGYFLRRQFDYFIDRNKGSIVMRFLEKARIAGHIQLLDTAHRRQVYHLFHKPIYRLIGAPDSQNRRVKGDADVRARLMRLDYVLENDQERYLESDDEKLEYFARTRGIDLQIFTSENRNLLPEIQSTLTSLEDRTQPATSLIRFIFVDDGLLTITKFQRVLTAMSELLRAVAHFELIYVATSDHNFRAAAAFFRKEFVIGSERWQEPLDPEWRSTPRNRPQSELTMRPQFTTLLLRFSYPSLQRNELHGSRQGSESIQ
jgi:hypothetical protein